MHAAVILGSDSDLPVMKKAFAILDEFGVAYDVTLASAHRTPQKLADFVAAEEKKGCAVFIAGAGMAAALPGVVASLTPRPVIGVPLSGSSLSGVDALYSIVQMPSGMPVATVAIDGAKNAAYLAIQMGALSDEALLEKYKAFRKKQADQIYEKDFRLQKELEKE